MPLVVIDQELTRSTLCVKRTRARGAVLCSDRVPVGAGTPLMVGVSWAGNFEESVTLTLSNPTSGGGDVVFDDASGGRSKTLPDTVSTLVTLWGLSPTSGAAPDVRLAVRLGSTDLPPLMLSVGPPAATTVTAAAAGGLLGPGHLPAGTRLQVDATPSAAGGTFAWATSRPADLRLVSGADVQTVEVESVAGGRVVSAADPVLLGVLYTPPGAAAAGPVASAGPVAPTPPADPAVAAFLSFVDVVNLFGRVEDRTVAPDYNGADGWLPLATHAFQVLNGAGVQVAAGTTSPTGHFAVTVPPAGGPFTLEFPALRGLVS
ncbi:MAG TPA: hypothetical protein VFR37_20900 [Longimicrobium sp.]|nr:hypothetical protein [Longimicrobium sp.]